MFAPLAMTPFATSLPAPVLPILAAAVAIAPVRLLYCGCLGDGRSRDHGRGRGANTAQANEAGCSREGNQGLAHGSDLPVRAMTLIVGAIGDGLAAASRRNFGAC